MQTINDRLGARIAAKLQSDVGHRADLHLADYRKAGDNLATICIAFDAGVGRPDVQDIKDYVTIGFKGRLSPHMSTLRLHADVNALTMNVSQARPSRPYKDVEAMVPNGPGRFIEASTNDVWEVEDNEGTPALYRVAEEDLDAILEARKQSASGRFASTRARIASIMDTGRVLAVPGANVLFFTDTGEEKVACVMSEADDHGQVSVRITGQEENIRIHENQIHEMLTTAELDANTKKLLTDYYTEAFGDAGYAQQLVSENVVTGPKEELVAFLTTAGAMDAHKAQAWADTLRISTGKVLTAGPNDMILARYNGFGFEWQVDMEKAEQAISAL